jgi:hypothetical protein
VDDTGFTATGDIRGVLHHEHLVLYRETNGFGSRGGAPGDDASPAATETT